MEYWIMQRIKTVKLLHSYKGYIVLCATSLFTSHSSLFTSAVAHGRRRLMFQPFKSRGQLREPFSNLAPRPGRETEEKSRGQFRLGAIEREVGRCDSGFFACLDEQRKIRFSSQPRDKTTAPRLVIRDRGCQLVVSASHSQTTCPPPARAADDCPARAADFP